MWPSAMEYNFNNIYFSDILPATHPKKPCNLYFLLTPFLTYSQTHTHIHIHTYTLTHIHACKHTHTHMHTNMPRNHTGSEVHVLHKRGTCTSAISEHGLSYLPGIWGVGHYIHPNCMRLNRMRLGLCSSGMCSWESLLSVCLFSYPCFHFCFRSQAAFIFNVLSNQGVNSPKSINDSL